MVLLFLVLVSVTFFWFAFLVRVVVCVGGDGSCGAYGVDMGILWRELTQEQGWVWHLLVEYA